MKVNITRIQFTIVLLWLAGFMVCVFTALFCWQDIPSSRDAFLKQSFEAFAPGLGVMLGVVFAKRVNSAASATEASSGDVATLTGWLALLIATLYVSAFAFCLLLFFLGRVNLEMVNTTFPVLRFYTGWLVLPIQAFYFGTTGKGPAPRRPKKNAGSPDSATSGKAGRLR